MFAITFVVNYSSFCFVFILISEQSFIYLCFLIAPPHIFYTTLELAISQLCAASSCSEREDLTVDGNLEYDKYIIIAALNQNKNLLGLISRLWSSVAPWVMQLSFLSLHIGSKCLLPKCLQWLFQIPHFKPRICPYFLNFLFSKFVWPTIYFFPLPDLWEIF